MAPLPGGCNAIELVGRSRAAHYKQKRSKCLLFYLILWRHRTLRHSHIIFLEGGKCQLLRDLLTNLFSIPCYPKLKIACCPGAHYAITWTTTRFSISHWTATQSYVYSYYSLRLFMLFVYFKGRNHPPAIPCITPTQKKHIHYLE